MLAALCLGSMACGTTAGVNGGERPLFPSFHAFTDSLHTLASIDDAATRDARITALLDTLQAHAQVPFTFGDSVAFLYRGDADSVAWHGSFDFYGRNDQMTTDGRRVGMSDVWMLVQRFPRDGRFDYWIVVDGQRILDPLNPRKSWGFQLQVSELRMPRYRVDPMTVRGPDVPRGTVSERQIFESQSLGYKVAYQVYTPAGYEGLSGLNVAYLTDGPAAVDDRHGRAAIVLDNLLAQRRLEPTMAVFIDPVNPDDPRQNRRNAEYTGSDAFAAFVARELVPFVDDHYQTSPKPDARAIVGVSFGGLNAAFFADRYPDVFGNIGMESPFLMGNPNIYDYFRRDRIDPKLKLFISSGTVSDAMPQVRPFLDILDARGIDYRFETISEGHTWTNDSRMLDDVLRYFWGR